MTSLSSIYETLQRAHRQLPAVLVACCLAGGATLATAFDDDGDSGSDPTVGTLPMGGSDDVELDQTLTLRGRLGNLEVVHDATGDGSFDLLDLGNGESLLRFYGDVQVELRLAVLAEIDLSIWSGFAGEGMAYAVETADGIGSTQGLFAGESLPLDPIRFANAGLLDGPMDVHGYHRTGVRTKTTLEFDATSRMLIVTQDV